MKRKFDWEAFVLALMVLLVVLLFAGEPDIHDAIVARLMPENRPTQTSFGEPDTARKPSMYMGKLKVHTIIVTGGIVIEKPE